MYTTCASIKFLWKNVILGICLFNFQITYAQEIKYLDVTTSPSYPSVKGEHKHAMRKNVILCGDKIIALKEVENGYVIQHFDTTDLSLTFTSSSFDISNSKFQGLKLIALNNQVYFVGFESTATSFGNNEIKQPLYLRPKYSQKFKHNWKYSCYIFSEDKKSINPNPKEIKDLSSIGCLRAHENANLVTTLRRTNLDPEDNFKYVVDFYNLNFEITNSLKFNQSEELVDYQIVDNLFTGIVVDYSSDNLTTSIITYDLSSKKLIRKPLDASLGGLIQSKLLITQDRMFIVSTSVSLKQNAPFERTIYKPSKLTLIELERNGTTLRNMDFELSSFETYSKRGTSGSEFKEMNIDKIEVKNGHITLVLSHLTKTAIPHPPNFAQDYPYGSSLILRIPTTDSKELEQILIHKTQLFERRMFDVGNFISTDGGNLQIFYFDYLKKHPKESGIYYAAKPNGSGLVGYELNEVGELTPFIAFDKKDVNGLQIEAFSPKNMIQLGDKVVVEVALKGGKQNTWIVISLD